MGIDMSNDLAEAKEMMDGGGIADTDGQQVKTSRKKKKKERATAIIGESTPTDVGSLESIDEDVILRAQSKLPDELGLSEQIGLLEKERDSLLEKIASLEIAFSETALAEDLLAAQQLVSVQEEALVRHELTITAQSSQLEIFQKDVDLLNAKIIDLEKLTTLQSKPTPKQLEEALQNRTATIARLERQVQELQSASQLLSDLQGQHKKVVEDNELLSGLLVDARRKLNESNERGLPNALLNRAAINMDQVDSAIMDLEVLIDDADTQSDSYKAVNKIIDCLKEGLASSSPQAYFDGKKDDLKTNLNVLRGLKSHFNTALNAILAVLAVCTVVGIPALWLTGTLQKNMEKNGSIFAFTMFGAKQKAECDIYQATQAMGVKLGA